MNRHRTLIIAAATLSAALWAYACGDGTTDPPPDPPRPTTVTVTPATAELTALGATEQLRAVVLDQYGQVMAGAAVSWASSAASVAAVDASGLVTAAGNGMVTITGTAGSASGTAAVTVAQRVSMVEVSPPADTVVERDTVRFEAVATDANGHAVAGAGFTWASGDTSVAVVDASGLVTGTGAGEVGITATSSGVVGRGELVVEAPVPTAVTVAPDTLAFTALGDTVRLMAVVRDQIGRVMEGEPVAWASGDAMVAVVDSAGLVTAAGNGMVTITGTAGSASGTAAVTVAQRVSMVEVSPPADTVVERDTVRFEAVATDANGHAVAGAGFTWASGDTSVAVVDASGLVTGTGAGEVGITATSSGVVGRGELVVEAPVPTAVTVAPDTLAFTALGDTVRLMAVVRDQIGRVMEGEPVAWASGDAMVAVVDSAGLVKVVGNGMVTITATAGSASGSATVTVAQEVSAVAVTPAADTVVTGDTLRLVAEAADANGHPVPGAEFDWASSDTMVAVVDDAGLVHGVAEGTATITAMAGDARGTAEITVQNPDRAALEALYHTTDGPNWVNSENWLNDAPLRDWYGVATDGQGRVTRLNLGGIWNPEEQKYDSNGLSGPIPIELVSLTNLRDLDLSYNALSGPIPIKLGNLASLTRLNLGPNNLSGPIPRELGNLSNLTWLWLGTNTLSGPIPRELGNLSNLTGLNLGTNNLSGPIPRELGNLSNLTWLWLGTNTLSGPIPRELGNLSNLTGLNLGTNNLSGPIPTELGNLASLRNLSLYTNRLSGPIPRELGNLASLRTLSLFLNRLTGPIPRELGNLSNLTVLVLGPNNLSGPIPRELGNLSNLTWLWLGTNTLSGPIPRELGNLSNLTVLNLGTNNLSGPIPRELGNLSSLRTLSLFLNRLTGPIPRELGNLSNLTGLWLYNNDLSGPIPRELGNLSNLTGLNLGTNNLSGPIPRELGNLASLRTLSLFLNRLTGPIPRELGNLSNLTGLWLYNNDLSGPVPPELGALSALEHLVLNFNRHLFGPLPATLTGLTELLNLQFVGTGLCAPQTTEFRQWLGGVAYVHGEECLFVQGSDRQALAAIYEWTNGDAWDTKTNWLGDGPLDDWYGVSADSTDRVTALDLSDNNLAGILPDEAGDLLYLETLTLNGNDKLSGELPGRMRTLASLVTLRLDSTGLCASTAAFRNWLNGISDARVTPCPDDHGNDATGATDVSVGQSAEGELESLADEDWFRVEVASRGKLTIVATGNTAVRVELHDGADRLLGYEGVPNRPVAQHVTPGTYHARAVGAKEETRGAYTLVTSFEQRRPGARAYLTQAVQSHDFGVPLVAAEDALLRVFVMADSGVAASMPPVLATFYRGSQEVHSVWIDGSSQQVPWTMTEGNLDATANAVVPGSVMLPGTEMVVEVDPDGTLDPSLGIGGRIPKEGRMALDIRNMPNFDVTAVPFLWTENPDSSGFKVAVGLTETHELFYETRDWLPVADIEVSVREAVLVDYDPKENMRQVLDDIALLHAADGASGYYMGVPPWKTSGIVGIAWLGSKLSVSRLDGHTIAHEFGHNFSLGHSPCGGPAGVDGRYPHSGGRIGTWGYDFRNGTLVDPDMHTDLMTYCGNNWISDYSFAKAVEYRAETQAVKAQAVAQGVLVVRGGVDGGRLRIEPAFVLDAPPTLPGRTGPYRLAGSDEQGAELFALSFEMAEIADAESEGDGGFTFAIPVRAQWAETLAAITLVGPEGSVSLTGDDPDIPSTALVLDAATGRIRAILRDPLTLAVAADRFSSALPRTVTLFSRGIPDAAAWSR